jgi:hypothetical protein
MTNMPWLPAAYRGSCISSPLYCATSPASSSGYFDAYDISRYALKVASWRRLNL